MGSDHAVYNRIQFLFLQFASNGSAVPPECVFSLKEPVLHHSGCYNDGQYADRDQCGEKVTEEKNGRFM
jgi:hypothetical protein